MKLSIKKLNELHEKIGGNEAGFFITIYGRCQKTNKHIYTVVEIAHAQKSQANWSYRLVKGRISDND